MTTSENWHDQWTAATRTLEMATLDLTTAVRTLPLEQLGALRRYRERVDEAQFVVERLKEAKPPEPDARQSDAWPMDRT